MPDTTTPEQHAVKPHDGRRKKILLSVIGVLVAIPVIAVIFILTFDWNKARPWLNAKVSEAIERPFAIRGNLAVQWEIPARRMAPGDRHLRDWLPWPHLIANDVHVGNPANMQQADMASVRQFSFSLNPFGLLHRTIGIPVLRFDAPRVDLVRTDNEHYNWVYKKKEEESKWKLDLERIVLTDGVVRVVDAVTKANVTAHVRTLDKDPKYGIGFEVGGSYNGAPVTGGGKVGQVLSLKDQDTPYPVQADMRSGPSRIAIEGTVTAPARLKAVDLQLELAGRSMARLYNFTGITLPETPAFSTSGRLRGELDREYGRWTYENFKGKVGSSDIHGKLVYEGGKPRGKLSGNVASNKLVFEDLGPLIGADSNASKKARGVEAVQPGGKVLPVEEFRTERWKAIDADVRYAADKIVREKTLPISKLSAHLIMKDGVITLAPLDFGVAGGTLRSTIRLDGSGKAGNTIAATAKVQARHIQIKQLFPTIEQMQATVGQVNGDAQLSATGTSVAALLVERRSQGAGEPGHGQQDAARDDGPERWQHHRHQAVRRQAGAAELPGRRLRRQEGGDAVPGLRGRHQGSDHPGRRHGQPRQRGAEPDDPPRDQGPAPVHAALAAVCARPLQQARRRGRQGRAGAEGRRRGGARRGRGAGSGPDPADQYRAGRRQRLRPPGGAGEDQADGAAAGQDQDALNAPRGQPPQGRPAAVRRRMRRMG